MSDTEKKYDDYLCPEDFNITCLYEIGCKKCSNKIVLVEHPFEYENIICSNCNTCYGIKEEE